MMDRPMNTDRLVTSRRYCECGHDEGSHGGDGKWCLVLRPNGPGTNYDRICWCEGFKEVKL